MAVDAEAAAERWLAALFCRWLIAGAEVVAATEGVTWEVATVGRVVEAATGVAEVVPMLLEGAVETRTAVDSSSAASW